MSSSKIDITAFDNKRILIVGDIILDEFIYTHSDRNSPEYTNTPILNITKKNEYLGGAANVALNIKKLNAIPYLIGTLGKDEAAEIIMRLLQEENISKEYIYQNNGIKTTKKTRLFKDELPVCRIDDETILSETTQSNQTILTNIQKAIEQHKPEAIILQDYNKGVLNIKIIPQIIALAKQHQLLITVDPKFKHWELFKNVDLFKPNKHELLATGKTLMLNDNTIVNISKVLHQKINYKNILVTLGADGNFMFDGVNTPITNPTLHLTQPDVCGAGDTVIAVATLSLLCKFTLAQIAKISNIAGFIVCQKKHVQPVELNELANSLNK